MPVAEGYLWLPQNLRWNSLWQSCTTWIFDIKSSVLGYQKYPRYTLGLTSVLENFAQILKIVYGNWSSSKSTVWKMFDTWLLQIYWTEKVCKGRCMSWRYIGWNIYKQLHQTHPGFFLDAFWKNAVTIFRLTLLFSIIIFLFLYHWFFIWWYISFENQKLFQF